MSWWNLEPCPFCGEEWKIILNRALTGDWYVQCESCLARAWYGVNEQDAAEKWNRRA